MSGKSELVDVFSHKVSTYSIETKDVLRICSCFGISRFSLMDVALLCRMHITEVWTVFQPLISDGWFKGNRKGYYSFTDSAILECAYRLLDQEEAIIYHRRIAEILLGNSNQKLETISSIIRELQYDIDNIKKNPSILTLYINLNIVAASGSFKTGEYESALQYINCAKQLLPVDPWADRTLYKTSMKVMKLKGDILVSLNRKDEALKLFQSLQSRVDNTTDLFKIKYRFLSICSALGQYEVIYDEYMDILAADSDTLCLVANDDSFIQQWIQDSVGMLRDMLVPFAPLSRVLELEENRNKHRRYFMKCLTQCIVGIYLGKNANKVYMFVTPLLLGRMVLQEGLCGEMTLPILAVLGWIVGFINDPDLGFQIASMAYQAGMSRCSTKKSFVMAMFFHCFAYLCLGSIHDVALAAENTFCFSTILEDSVWSPLSGIWIVFSKLYAGGRFETIQLEYERVKEVCLKMQNSFLLDVCKADLAVARGLSDETITQFDPDFGDDKIEDLPFSRASVRFAKAMWHFFHDEFKVAYICIKETGSLIEDAFGTPLHLVYRWYSCVICASRFETYNEVEEEKESKKTFSIMEAMLGRNASPPKNSKEKILDEFKKQLSETEQLYKSFGNFMEAAFILNQAEAVRLGVIDDLTESAVNLYLRSIEVAKKSNLPMLAAVACTRLISLPDIVSDPQRMIYVENAVKLWNSLGAKYMVNKLVSLYDLQIGSLSQMMQIPSNPSHHQALESFYELESSDKILREVLYVIVEFIQASRGCLILKKNENYFLVTDTQHCGTSTCAPLSDCSHLMNINLIQQVVETGTYYLHRESSMEIWTAPILDHDNIIKGVFYLESTIPETFSEAKCQSLMKLVSIVAINTPAYDDSSTEVTLSHNLCDIFQKARIEELQKGMSVISDGCIQIFSVSVYSTETNESLESSELISDFIDVAMATVDRCQGITCFYSKSILLIFFKKIQQAITSAIDIVEATRSFNEARSHQKQYLEVCIALDYGKAEISIMGIKRSLHSFIGDPAGQSSVTSVQILQQFGKSIHTPIALTAKMRDALHEQNIRHLEYRLLGNFVICNQRAQEVYEVFNSSKSFYTTEYAGQILRELEIAIRLFYQGSFQEAQLEFQKIGREIEKRRLTKSHGIFTLESTFQLYTKLCKSYLSDAEISWSGSVELDSKGQVVPATYRITGTSISSDDGSVGLDKKTSTLLSKSIELGRNSVINLQNASSAKSRNSLNADDVKQLREQVTSKIKRIEQLNEKVDRLTAENEELRKEQLRTYEIAQIAKKPVNKDPEKASCFAFVFQKRNSLTSPRIHPGD